MVKLFAKSFEEHRLSEKRWHLKTFINELFSSSVLMGHGVYESASGMSVIMPACSRVESLPMASLRSTDLP
ncbi:hypothetical protein CXP35_12635 [Komagataeibacter xylinus]|nr:hypothetical protein CXP35_12635 [Komagataeibacter xylinus]